MKIAILGDTHFGVRSDAHTFHKNNEKFYENIFFPELEKHGIREVYQLGDLFDRRKYINFVTLDKAKKYFFDPLHERNIHLHTLIGNHDIFYRDTLQVNSQNLLLGEYDNITIYDNPATISIEGLGEALILPWICRENEAEIFDLIKNSKASICMGHFEIDGFSMYQGIEAKEGISPSIFKDFHYVFSGHYHHRSFKGNIMYVGSPVEMTWSDFDDPKGFHILETETEDVEFIENPYIMFKKVYYDETKSLEDPKNSKEKYIRVVVENKKDQYKFDNYINSLYHAGAHDIKIVETFSDIISPDDQQINLEDTLSIVQNYIDQLGLDKEKTDNIKQYTRKLYNEAINLEF